MPAARTGSPLGNTRIAAGPDRRPQHDSDAERRSRPGRSDPPGRFRLLFQAGATDWMKSKRWHTGSQVEPAHIGNLMARAGRPVTRIDGESEPPVSAEAESLLCGSDCASADATLCASTLYVAAVRLLPVMQGTSTHGSGILATLRYLLRFESDWPALAP